MVNNKIINILNNRVHLNLSEKILAHTSDSGSK